MRCVWAGQERSDPEGSHTEATGKLAEKSLTRLCLLCPHQISCLWLWENISKICFFYRNKFIYAMFLQGLTNGREYLILKIQSFNGKGNSLHIRCFLVQMIIKYTFDFFSREVCFNDCLFSNVNSKLMSHSGQYYLGILIHGGK